MPRPEERALEDLRERECDCILVGTFTELFLCVKQYFKIHYTFHRAMPSYLQGIVSETPMDIKTLRYSDPFCKMVLGSHKASLQPPVHFEASLDD